MKRLGEDLSIFSISGVAYCLLEIIWRHYTHWTMAITGGICFLVLFRLYNKIRNVPLILKCTLGSFVITFIEFISGCVVNLWLGLNVWDYSYLPINIMGQVCLLYSFLWGLLCIPIEYVSVKLNKKYLQKQ